MLFVGSASRFWAASSYALSPESSSSFWCCVEPNNDAPVFLIGGTPPDWKLKILPVPEDDGVLLNNPPVFGWFEAAPLFANNPVLGLDPNNPLPVLLANKLEEVLANNPLPLAGVLTVV